MILKEDLKEAKERAKAWWDHEIIDRPMIGYTYRTTEKNITPYNMGDWTLGQKFDAYEESVNNFEDGASKLFYGGESIPSYFPNYGAGIIAAVLGIKPIYGNNTVWLVDRMEINEMVDILENVKLNDNNEWYVRLKRCTKYAANRGKGKYQVAVADLGGIMDILCSFIGPQKMIVALKRNTTAIDTCRAIILEKTLQMYDELQNIIESHGHDGCDAWLGLWSHKHWYPMQCDISAMMSPKYFRRFVLPDLIAQAEHMDYSFYHLDGSEQLIHLDDIISHPSITGIQWVPGVKPDMPQEWDEHWFPLYKKIQNAGKNLIIPSPAWNVNHIYKNLNHKGLFVKTSFKSKEHINCYLPTFMGNEADGGITIDKISGIFLKEGNFSPSKDAFKELIAEKKIDVKNLNKAIIFSEVSKKLTKLKQRNF